MSGKTLLNRILRIGMIVVAVAGAQTELRGTVAPSRTCEESLPERPAVLDEIRHLIREQQKFADGARQAKALLPEYEREFGPESVQVAWVLDLVVEALWRDVHGREDETLSLALRAVAIKERCLPSDPIGVTRSLISLGEVRVQRGEDEEALRLFLEAAERRERILPAGHREIWIARIYVGTFHLRTQDYAAALEAYEKALASLPSPEDPEARQVLSDRILTLRSIGIVLQETEAYSDSLAIYEEVLDVRRQLGKLLDVASALNSLALLEDDIGLYGDAVGHYLEALEIRHRELEADHPYIADLHNNLGTTYRSMGRYDDALEQFELARGIYLERNSELDVALVSSNMASTLRLMRDEIEAERLFDEALRVRVEQLPADAPRIADTRRYFASLLLDMGRCEGAGKHLREATPIVAIKYRDAPAERALLLRVRARYEEQCGDPDRALTFLEKALAAQRESLGDDHPWTAETRTVLASHHVRAGEYGRALAEQGQAVESLRRSLMEDHPLLLEALVAEAELKACSGQREAAVALALQAGRRLREHVRSAIRALPPRQALRYAGSLATVRNLTLSIASVQGTDPAVRGAWAAQVSSRSLVREEMAVRGTVARASGEETLHEITQRLEVATRRVAEVLSRGPAGASTDAYRDLVESLLREKEGLEHRLARLSDEIRPESAPPTGLGDVEGALAAGTALVAFSEYVRLPCLAPRDGLQDPAPGGNGAGRPHYAAFVRPAGGGDLRLFSLGAAADIDGLVRAWLTNAGRPPPRNPAAAILAEKSLSEVGAQLRERVWDPLASAMGEAAEVILVPAGELNLVNFDALPAPGGGYMVEGAPLLRYASAERDLAEPRGNEPSGKRILVMGGPDFNRRGPAPESAASTATRSKPRAGRSGDITNCPGFESMTFPTLVEASAEVEEIGQLWRDAGAGRKAAATPSVAPAASDEAVVVLTGAAATEGAFKRWAVGSRVLHVATHAFSLENECGSALQAVPAPRDGRGISILSSADAPPTPWLPGDAPLFLSGLAFAGANRREAADPAEIRDDGILTAAEITSLDLQGVELVVLSACDTARGRIETGEGVYGLRRAFEIAGAESVLVSLWKVEDRATREWMTALYRESLVGGAGLPEAVRNVSRSLLARQRERSGMGHPFRWAPFVALGARSGDGMVAETSNLDDGSGRERPGRDSTAITGGSHEHDNR